MNVSIIIPVYNGGTQFQQCLNSIFSQNDWHEIIVIDDASTDDSATYAQQQGTQVIQLDTNHGPAYARNSGAQHATGDILFFVDADVTLHADILRKLHDIFSDASISAVIGSYDDAPGHDSFLSQYRNLLHHYVHQQGNPVASTFWGACGAIRRDVFLEIGGFDADRYPQPSIEDIELGYRLRKAGHSIRLQKDLYIKHLKRWTAKSILRTDFFGRALPWTRLILEQDTAVNDLNIDISGRLSVALMATLLSSIVLIALFPFFGIITLIAALSLLWLNRALYKFYWQKRGFWFMVRVVPWHWLYFFYSGLAFAVGHGIFYWDAIRSQSQLGRTH